VLETRYRSVSQVRQSQVVLEPEQQSGTLVDTTVTLKKDPALLDIASVKPVVDVDNNDANAIIMDLDTADLYKTWFELDDTDDSYNGYGVDEDEFLDFDAWLAENDLDPEDWDAIYAKLEEQGLEFVDDDEENQDDGSAWLGDTMGDFNDSEEWLFDDPEYKEWFEMYYGETDTGLWDSNLFEEGYRGYGYYGDGEEEEEEVMWY